MAIDVEKKLRTEVDFPGRVHKHVALKLRSLRGSEEFILCGPLQTDKAKPIWCRSRQRPNSLPFLPGFFLFSD